MRLRYLVFAIVIGICAISFNVNAHPEPGFAVDKVLGDPISIADDAAFSSDGSMVAIKVYNRYPSNHLVRIYHTNTWNKMKDLAFDDWISVMAFSKDDNLLAVGMKNEIKIFRTKGWELTVTLKVHDGREDHYPYSIIFLPGSDRLLTATASNNDERGEITIWDTGSWTRLKSMDVTIDHHGRVLAAPDGRHIAVLRPDLPYVSDAEIQIYETSSWDMKAEIRSEGWIKGMTYAGNGSDLVYAYNGNLTRYDLVNYGEPSISQHPGLKHVIDSGDQTRVLARTDNGLVWIDIKTGDIVKEMDFRVTVAGYQAHKDTYYGALVNDMDDYISIYDLEEGSRIKVFGGHAGKIVDFDLDPWGYSMVTCDEHGEIIVWDYPDGTEKARINASSTLSEVHKWTDPVAVEWITYAWIALGTDNGHVCVFHRNHTVDGYPWEHNVTIDILGGLVREIIYEAGLLFVAYDHSEHGDGGVVALNTNNWSEVFRTDLDHLYIKDIAISPRNLNEDDHNLAIASTNASQSGGLITEYSTRYWTLRGQFFINGTDTTRMDLNSVCYSRDGKYIAYSYSEDRFILKDRSKTYHRSIYFDDIDEYYVDHTDHTRSMSFTFDSEYLMTSHHDGILVWNVTTGLIADSIHGGLAYNVDKMLPTKNGDIHYNRWSSKIHRIGLDTDKDDAADSWDQFDKDPAASIDSDRDGYPDEWNYGMTEEDSRQGLKLDAFPDDRWEWEDLNNNGIGDNADSREKKETEDKVYTAINVTVIAVAVLIGILLINSLNRLHKMSGRPPRKR